jgi:DNA repair protein RadC
MNQLRLYQELKVRVQLVRETKQIPTIKIQNPDDLYSILHEEIESWDREKFLSILLDVQNKIIGIDEISIGSLTCTIVHPREIFKSAILANAASIILVHNHPSGSTDPSEEDKKITEKIKRAAEIMDIGFLDHFIISKNGYTSCFTEMQKTKTDIPF